MNKFDMFAIGLIVSWFAAFVLVFFAVAAIAAPFPINLVVMACIPPVMLGLAIVVRSTIADFNEWRNK